MFAQPLSLSPYLDIQSLDWGPIESYIDQTWACLTRGPSHVKEAMYDGMLETYAPIYVSATEDRENVESLLRNASDECFAKQLQVRILPPDGKFGDVDSENPHGLLYVPGEYVVPGGRFNELYGWDSYFIVEGLLRNNKLALAASIIDAQLYEVEHYGTVLNANRTYFLSRSQPPLLSKMVLALHNKQPDEERLQRALPLLETLHAYWVNEPNLDPASGLSRYHDTADGPSAEVVVSERDAAGRTHYERLETHFKENLTTLLQKVPDIHRYYDVETDKLTDEFYRGDRAMRASGFDPSNRFGPFSGACHQHLPVCLNSLLYGLENDIATIHTTLKNEPAADGYLQMAGARNNTMQKILWSDEQRCFQDWDMEHQERRYYPYLTMFYPMWTGQATRQQAQALVQEHLPKFLRPGGLVSSLEKTGQQWDAPFAWAPLQLVVVEGLRQYGFHEEAKDIATRFLHMVHQDFERSGTLLEKYNAETCSGQVEEAVDFGYAENNEGFGWTNGVVSKFLEYYNNNRS